MGCNVYQGYDLLNSSGKSLNQGIPSPSPFPATAKYLCSGWIARAPIDPAGDLSDLFSPVSTFWKSRKCPAAQSKVSPTLSPSISDYKRFLKYDTSNDHGVEMGNSEHTTRKLRLGRKYVMKAELDRSWKKIGRQICVGACVKGVHNCRYFKNQP